MRGRSVWLAGTLQTIISHIHTSMVLYHPFLYFQEQDHITYGCILLSQPQYYWLYSSSKNTKTSYIDNIYKLIMPVKFMIPIMLIHISHQSVHTKSNFKKNNDSNMLKLQGYEASLSGCMAVSKHNRQKFALRFSKNTKLQNANVITKSQ